MDLRQRAGARMPRSPAPPVPPPPPRRRTEADAPRAELARQTPNATRRLPAEIRLAKVAEAAATNRFPRQTAARRRGANLAAARQMRRALRAERELRGIASSGRTCTSSRPLDGVVTAREAEPGTTVVAGQAVLRLVDPASLWVKRAHRSGARRAACRRDRPPTSCCARIRRGRWPEGGARRNAKRCGDRRTHRRCGVRHAARADFARRDWPRSRIQLPAAQAVPTVPPAPRIKQRGEPDRRVAVLRDGSAAFKPVQPRRADLDGSVQVRDRPAGRRRASSCYSENSWTPRRASSVVDAGSGAQLHDQSGAARHRSRLGKLLLTGLGLGLLIGVTLTMAGVYRGMVDDAKVLLRQQSAPISGWCSSTPSARCRTLQPAATTLYRAFSACPACAQTGNVTYLTMQVSHGRARCARDGRRLRAGPAGRAGLPGGGPPDHALPLRGDGRRQDRICGGRCAFASAATTTRWSA